MATTQKPMVLIDGSSYLFRAFHALPPLTNTKGQPTGAVYGVINMIRKLMADYDPEYIGVIFDAKGKTFRDALYPEYKANRSAMPEELRVQIKPLHAIIKAMGLPLIVVDGVEADDVIGTLVKKAKNQGLPSLVSTGDKDMAQLVDEDVVLINTMSNKLMDIQGVRDKFGVDPNKIIDYLTLIGDSVDNIPGVPKVGPKTAAKWLKEYGSLDQIVDNADKMTGKVGEYLRDSLDQLPLSKQLVTIKTDVDLPLELSELSPQTRDNAALVEWFREMEFKTWLTEALQETTGEENKIDKDYDIVVTHSQLDSWIQKLSKASAFAFDTETTSLNPLRAKLVGLSVAVDPHAAAYVPLGHDYPGAPAQLTQDEVLSAIKPLLQDPQKTVIGQNLKYDINVLDKYGVSIRANIMDTMLQSYVLNSTSSRHDMDSLALKYLGVNTIHFEALAGKGKKQLTFNQIEVEKAGEYAAEDADITLQLHHALNTHYQKAPELQRLLEEMELPLMPVLAKMERTGVLIDCEKLSQQSEVLAKRLAQLEDQAFKEAGEVFNLSSPKQLRAILFEKHNLPVVRKTPTGAASTAEDVLETLAHDYALPQLILEYRSLSKLKSTYTDALPKQINPDTGRVHTSYNQAVAATGRLSSTEPNLQNIPARRPEGRLIRQAFIVPKGHKIVAADYSQIELRIMAELSKDVGLRKAFSNGHDVHRATAAEVFSVAFDDVTPDQRRRAKAINFGLIYGMSAFGLAKQIGSPRQEAQQYIDTYFQRYPGIKDYMDNVRQLAHEQGYVETLFGRRLYLPEINTSNKMRQRAAERTAINAPMQGTAADIIKLAMIKVSRWLEEESLNQDVKMIMQVHDELVFEVADAKVEKVCQRVDEIMTQSVELSVPIEVSIGVGENWDEAH